jgi:hypothetical protein
MLTFFKLENSWKVFGQIKHVPSGRVEQSADVWVIDLSRWTLFIQVWSLPDNSAETTKYKLFG